MADYDRRNGGSRGGYNHRKRRNRGRLSIGTEMSNSD